MRFETRLKRLEQRTRTRARSRPAGRCDACKDRPSNAIIRWRRSAPDQPAVPHDDSALGERCVCGWRPSQVVRVEETIVFDRANAEAAVAEAERLHNEGRGPPVVRA